MKQHKNIKEQIDIFYQKMGKAISPELKKLNSEFDNACGGENTEVLLGLIKKAKIFISDSNNTPSNMQLYYCIANAYTTLKRLDSIKSKQHLEKEIYALRQVLDICESKYSFINDENYEDYDISTDSAELFASRYIAVRTYINLGNTLHSTGRYVAAIDSFINALSIDKYAAMASMNLSSALFEYGYFQNKKYESDYYYHAAYRYYEQTKKNKINLESESYLKRFEGEFIEPILPKAIIDFFSNPLKFPIFKCKKKNERKYRQYIAIKRLFLEPCLDIFSSKSCFMVDSLSLPLTAGQSQKDNEFIGLFNLLKQEFVSARYLWYQTTMAIEPENHYSDKETDMVEIGEKDIFSLREILLRNAFKTAYSIFDKIGFFINHYFDIGLEASQVSFKNIWKLKLKDQRGNVYCDVQNPLNIESNLFLKAIFWLQKDFYEDKNVNITNPSAIRLFQMRNDMEHNYLLSVERIEKKSSYITKYITPYQIDDGTERILRLARECLIYLTLAVGIDRARHS